MALSVRKKNKQLENIQKRFSGPYSTKFLEKTVTFLYILHNSILIATM